MVWIAENRNFRPTARPRNASRNTRTCNGPRTHELSERVERKRVLKYLTTGRWVRKRASQISHHPRNEVVPLRRISNMALLWTSEPPNERTPYVVPQMEGERLTIPGSKGSSRIVASSKQTAGVMSVFLGGGVVADAPGFHWHQEAHDIFMCTKGFLKVWNGNKCRILGPGDFASVPPVRRRLTTLIWRG